MKIRSLMTSDLVTLAPDDTLETAMKRMDTHDVRHLPIVQGGRLLGILSERDVLEATGWDPSRTFEASESRLKVARDYMNVPVETVCADDDLSTAARRLIKHGIGCLPVVDGADSASPVGIVSEWDFARTYAQRFLKSASRDVSVHDVMVASPMFVDTDLSVIEANEICRTNRVRHLAVKQDGWFAGMISDRELRLHIGCGDADLRKVGDVMTSDLLSVSPGDFLAEAAEKIVRYKFDALPVTEPGPRLVGILTTTDILAAFVRPVGADA